MSRQRTRNYHLKQDDRGIWHCDFSVAGNRIQRSTFTQDRAKAEEWCAEVASRIWREKKLGEAREVKWEEAVVEWLRIKVAEGKRDVANDQDKGALLTNYLGGMWLHDLTDNICNAALDEEQQKRGWSGTTRNRHRSFITGVLNMARKKKWKVAEVNIERRPEPTARLRWLSKEEAVRLLAELPLHLKRMAEFALMTGLRQANVTGLRWRDVDLDRRIAWVWAEQAKAKKHIAVPLNDRAVAILREAKACTDHGSATYAFTYYGKAVLQPNGAAWVKALKRAGIEDFRWHDLRHTWASWHVMGWMRQDGTPTPLPVLQKLGGWADIKMVLRYAHIAHDYTAQYVGDVSIEGGKPTTALRVA